MSGNGALHFLTETLGWRFLFALLLSIALWARLTLEQNPERRDLYPTDIPVEASGLSPGLVVANEVQPVQPEHLRPQPRAGARWSRGASGPRSTSAGSPRAWCSGTWRWRSPTPR